MGVRRQAQSPSTYTCPAKVAGLAMEIFNLGLPPATGGALTLVNNSVVSSTG